MNNIFKYQSSISVQIFVHLAGFIRVTKLYQLNISIN